MRDIACHWKGMEPVEQMADKLESIYYDKRNKTVSQLQIMNLFLPDLDVIIMLYLFCY